MAGQTRGFGACGGSGENNRRLVIEQGTET
jgi:hypothetical protein